jgi:hypothetical protein
VKGDGRRETVRRDGKEDGKKTEKKKEKKTETKMIKLYLKETVVRDGSRLRGSLQCNGQNS